MVKSIESRGNKVLGVVTKELKGGKHGNTSVLELVELTLGEFLITQLKLSGIEISEVSIVVNGSNKEEHLSPAKSRDGVDSSYSVRNIRELEARSDLTRESVDFLDDVSNNSELGNTAVLEFAGTVLVEGGLVDSVGEAKRIEESGRSDNSELVLVGHGESRGGGLVGSWGEGGSRGDKGGDDGGLHVAIFDKRTWIYGRIR